MRCSAKALKAVSSRYLEEKKYKGLKA